MSLNLPKVSLKDVISPNTQRSLSNSFTFGDEKDDIKDELNLEDYDTPTGEQSSNKLQYNKYMKQVTKNNIFTPVSPLLNSPTPDKSDHQRLKSYQIHDYHSMNPDVVRVYNEIYASGKSDFKEWNFSSWNRMQDCLKELKISVNAATLHLIIKEVAFLAKGGQDEAEHEWDFSKITKKKRKHKWSLMEFALFIRCCAAQQSKAWDKYKTCNTKPYINENFTDMSFNQMNNKIAEIKNKRNFQYYAKLFRICTNTYGITDTFVHNALGANPDELKELLDIFIKVVNMSNTLTGVDSADVCLFIARVINGCIYKFEKDYPDYDNNFIEIYILKLIQKLEERLNEKQYLNYFNLCNLLETILTLYKYKSNSKIILKISKNLNKWLNKSTNELKLIKVIGRFIIKNIPNSLEELKLLIKINNNIIKIDTNDKNKSPYDIVDTPHGINTPKLHKQNSEENNSHNNNNNNDDDYDDNEDNIICGKHINYYIRICEKIWDEFRIKIATIANTKRIKGYQKVNEKKIRRVVVSILGYIESLSYGSFKKDYYKLINMDDDIINMIAHERRYPQYKLHVLGHEKQTKGSSLIPLFGWDCLNQQELNERRILVGKFRITANDFKHGEVIWQEMENELKSLIRIFDLKSSDGLDLVS